MLPPLERPDILDIGCGPGGPTLELAKMSGGRVTGLDNHQPYLDRLIRRAEELGFSERVRVINGSMADLPFPDESFDVIWTESAIYIVGFETGLREWKRFLKPDGCLVVSEVAWLTSNPPQEVLDWWKSMYPSISTAKENLDKIRTCGYDLLGHFPLPSEAWWTDYYGPLEKKMEELRAKYAGDEEAQAVIDEHRIEIDMFQKYNEHYGYVFFVMQKK